MDEPLVSVLMPAYNHAPFIEKAIRSVWNQTWRPIELIVVDDRSPDASFDVATALIPESPIPMKVLRNAQNKGITGTLNRALDEARGEWIAILASDDWFAPEKTALQLAEARRLGPEYGCIHCDSYLVDEAGTRELGTVYAESTLPPMLDDTLVDLAFGRANMVAISAMARRSAIDAMGGFDESLRAEDFDFHLGLAGVTRYGFVAEPLTYSRVVEGSLGKSPQKYLSEMFVVLAKHREALGSKYHEAVRIRAVHAVNISLAHEYWAGISEAFDHGLDACETRGQVLEFLRSTAVISTALLGRRLVAPWMGARVRRLGSEAYQRWLYRQEGNRA